MFVRVAQPIKRKKETRRKNKYKNRNSLLRFFVSFDGRACKGNFAVSFHDKVILYVHG